MKTIKKNQNEFEIYTTQIAYDVNDQPVTVQVKVASILKEQVEEQIQALEDRIITFNEMLADLRETFALIIEAETDQ